MKKKYAKLLACFLILLIGCGKRNFFPDEDDPGLSRFTSRGYNIATMYINDVPYINPYRKPLFGGIVNAQPTINLLPTTSAFDTLNISWEIEINDSAGSYNRPYYTISLLMPVPKGFTSHDLLAMNGKRFASDSDAISLDSPYSYPTRSGKSNIYFVDIHYMDSTATSTRSYALSGLFNGNIGDSILITKGRFDFQIDADQIKF